MFYRTQVRSLFEMANVNLVAVVEGRVCDSSVTADSLVHELGNSLAIFTIRSQIGIG